MYCVVNEVRVPAISIFSKETPIVKTVYFPEDAIITEIRIEPHLYPLEIMHLNITIYDQNDMPHMDRYTFSSREPHEKVLSARNLYVIIGEANKPIHIKKIEFSAVSNEQGITGYFVIWILYWTKEPKPFYQVI